LPAFSSVPLLISPVHPTLRAFARLITYFIRVHRATVFDFFQFCLRVFVFCFVLSWAKTATDRIVRAAIISIFNDFILICFNVQGKYRTKHTEMPIGRQSNCPASIKNQASNQENTIADVHRNAVTRGGAWLTGNASVAAGRSPEGISIKEAGGQQIPTVAVKKPVL
jgi:hypothetical protein